MWPRGEKNSEQKNVAVDKRWEASEGEGLITLGRAAPLTLQTGNPQRLSALDLDGPDVAFQDGGAKHDSFISG